MAFLDALRFMGGDDGDGSFRPSTLSSVFMMAIPSLVLPALYVSRSTLFGSTITTPHYAQSHRELHWFVKFGSIKIGALSLFGATGERFLHWDY